MVHTEHAKKRMHQRGISRDKVRLILQYGDTFPVAGGAELCMVSKRGSRVCQEHRSD